MLVSAALPSSFGRVIASGPPVPRASPAISLFEVIVSCYYHGSRLRKSGKSVNCKESWLLYSSKHTQSNLQLDRFPASASHRGNLAQESGRPHLV